MKRANIYDATTNEYISYLLLSDQLNGRFNIYSTNGKYIAYGNLKNNQIWIYDSESNQYIAYGNLNNTRFNLYSSETNKYISYGMFS